MHFPSLAYPFNPDRANIAAATYADEIGLIRQCAVILQGDQEEAIRIESLADQMVVRLRHLRQHAGGMDALLALYPLDSTEGRALLSLAEALPRIPDNTVADQLIKEKLGSANWYKEEKKSEGTSTLLSNLAARSLVLASHLSRFWASEALIRTSLRTSMDWLGHQFVMAETIYDALEQNKSPFLYSYDMLGESAVGDADAQQHQANYAAAIHHIGLAAQGVSPNIGPGVSIKLSALHPAYRRQQWPRIRSELLIRLRKLAHSACEYNLNFTLDAEESERLDLQLDLFAELAHDPALAGWDGLGIAVQAYQKRALAVIEWLGVLAKTTDRRFMVRLVKGAYWDSEIKRAQMLGLPDYPVFTHKSHTDISYLACLRRLFELSNQLYPQIATHNPVTAIAAHIMAQAQDFEFQCLYGMGEDLYALTQQIGLQRPCRIYAPIGPRRALLPYLVRRMLENGANSSFVHQLFVGNIINTEFPPKILPNQSLPPPGSLYLPRKNSAGIAWSDEIMLTTLDTELEALADTTWHAEPMLGTHSPNNSGYRQIFNPANQADLVGIATESDQTDIDIAVHTARLAAPTWQAHSISSRVAIIERTADLLEQNRASCIHLLVREAGKTLPDAHNELREAVDLCRYYAQSARSAWLDLPPKPLGIILAISPWNFPLAIFIGQIVAALLAGNSVLAKPSEKTPLIAALACRLLLQAGVPSEVLLLLPGSGQVAAAVLNTQQCNGVAFTGSLGTARRIRRQLAEYAQAVPLLAETGGINAMLVDSSVCLEQTVADIAASAFNSAGQRCSALRILCVQEDIAAALLNMLKSAMAELNIGDPSWLSCDIGPVIDGAALARVHDSLSEFRTQGKIIWQPAFDKQTLPGFFIPPTLVEIRELSDMPGEIFGPVLCILRYKAKKLPELLQELAASGYGLTLGLQSRLNSLIDTALATLPVGNYYVNRSQIGAVVESQPFGGCRLSGTGPKAGGPWYLWHFVRDADPCRSSYAHPTAVSRKLDELARQWPVAIESGQLIAYFEDYARRTPIGKNQRQTGPTGETNTLAWRGRGVIACTGPSAFDYFHQMGVALLTDNQVVMEDTAVTRALQQNLPGATIRLSNNPLGQPDLDAVLCNHDCRHIEAQLSVRQGTIVPVILPLSDTLYPLYQLISEFSISVNTAAIGGNIELLSGQSD